MTLILSTFFLRTNRTTTTSNVERLTVKCPSCGRTGKLPQGVTTFPKTVKCTGCQTRFSPVQDSAPKFRGFELPAYEVLSPVLDHVPVKQDPPLLPLVEVSTSTPTRTRPARKTVKSMFPSVALLLLAVTLTIGATVLTMRLLSGSGSTSQVLTDVQGNETKTSASDSKAQEEAFLVSELDKWVANQLSRAKPLASMAAPPVSCRIKSIYEAPPFTRGNVQIDQLSGEKGEKLVATYRANVDLEFESEAHTLLHKVVRYRLVKYSPSDRWSMAEGDFMIVRPH